jgi:5-methylthioadenosine/S-adenosylhomocysteine deaminase
MGILTPTRPVTGKTLRALAQRIDLLICPRWTLTMAPGASLHDDLCVAVNHGRIIELAPTERALAQYDPATVLHRPEHVLMPGLVNAHTHAAMTLLRGYADDIPLERWLKERIWPAELRLATPQFVADGTRLAVAEMLRGGITCFSDMYFFPNIAAEAALSCGIRATVGMIVLEFASPWARTAAEYISKGLAVRDQYKGHPLIGTAFAPHAPYSVSDETLRRVRKLADELEVPIEMHVHETATEVAEALEQTGQRPLARLAAHGLLNASFIAIHATQLTCEEIGQLAESGASVIHCPRSNMKLASGACPVAELHRAGVNVALGTDGAASNNRLDLWADLQTAALLGKLIANDAAAIPALAALEMATLGGARALGLADQIGSLEPGKQADMICVALDDLSLQPVFDPISHLVYAASREQVTDAWVAGEHLLRERNLVRIDAADLAARAASWRDRVIVA